MSGAALRTTVCSDRRWCPALFFYVRSVMFLFPFVLFARFPFLDMSLSWSSFSTALMVVVPLLSWLIGFVSAMSVLFLGVWLVVLTLLSS
ncbi:hypothetical protein TSUD_182820 [Trifolium subterraneum]|uniref:Uncharacterized protein n=1 Tax=Trifolium subterraneum TaxID=3900 RepID=A0A2Z6MDF5_TRISU|nr:hypothetical protein TSUD_182820 [Trifolium subterraneum]